MDASKLALAGLTSFATICPDMALQIFYSLQDLDEAVGLSQTCKSMRAVFLENKSLIAMKIAQASETYKYDRILNVHESAVDRLRWRYDHSFTNDQNKLDPIRKQDARDAIARLQDPIPRIITTKEGDMIYQRWRLFKLLRYSYTKLASEFEAAHSHQEAGVKPLPEATLDTLFEANDPQDLGTRSTTPRISANFTARFHQALCLHSIAMALRQLGMASHYEEAPSIDAHEGQAALKSGHAAWLKHSQTFPNYSIEISREAKYDSLEVYDLIYSFLLPELFPRDRYVAWIGPCCTKQYRRIVTQSLTMDYCEAYMYPSDVATLLEHRIWEKGVKWPGVRAAAYLKMLGFMESIEIDGEFDWWNNFSREELMLGLITPKLLREVIMNASAGNNICWYDRVRKALGSPFLADSGWPGDAEVEPPSSLQWLLDLLKWPLRF